MDNFYNRKIKKPWPTSKAMEQIYEQNLWGRGCTEFYSGDGSHQRELVAPYIKAVGDFLKQFDNSITVCDLGCGDFNVGRQLVPNTKKYIAIDIVPKLIEWNQSTFKQNNLEFQCLNIAKDQLPTADCAFLRQVLQHLSNSEVQSILDKLKGYKYVILTEHLPNGEFTPNVDIVSGQGTRLKKQSGLNITKPPFNFKFASQKHLVSVSSTFGKGVIVTTLFEM